MEHKLNSMNLKSSKIKQITTLLRVSGILKNWNCSSQKRTFKVIKAARPLTTTLISPIKIDTELSFVSIDPFALKNLITIISIRMAKKKKGIAISVTSEFIILSRFNFIPFLFFGGPVGIRTPDPLIKSQLLYQLSYRPLKYMLLEYTDIINTVNKLL